MCHRPGKLVFPAIRSFQNLQHLGAGAGRAAKPPLPVLSFSCLNHKGKRDPTQPLPPAHVQSESIHSAADSHFPCSIFRVPGPTLPHMLPPSWSSTTPWSCSPNGPYLSPSPTTEPDPERKLPHCASVQTPCTLSCYGCSDSDLSHWPSLLAVSPVPLALPYPNASPHSPITGISRSLLQTPLPPVDSMDFLACFCHWLLTATCPSVLSAHELLFSCHRS